MRRAATLFMALALGPGSPALAQDDEERSDASRPEALAADDTRDITGSLGYVQRIALPPDAEAVVVAQGRFGAMLGEVILSSDGRQVPLPFEITVPSGLSGTVGAVIRVHDRARWVLEGREFEAGHDSVDLGELTLEPVTPLAFATEFECGNTAISIGILNDEMVMQAEGREIQLAPVRTPSGARYDAVNDPDTHVWNRGKNVTVRLEGRDLPECLRVPSEAEAPYRAQGNEPGWHVAFEGDAAEVVADYGEITRTSARPEVQIMPGAYEFHMPEANATLRIKEQLCHDDATGMPHPDTALLTLDDRELRGCGGNPSDLLTEDVWRITGLGDADLIQPERLSLNFLSPGRVAGSSGCNRLVGSFNLTGEGLQFGAMGSTMMACSEPLMEQERRMLDALEQVTRFDITQDGALVLIGGGDDEILLEARRP